MSVPYILGIDTSNYKTSVAIVSKEGEILCNIQEYLEVKKGERGLRQSAALFQHINKLPELIERAFAENPGIQISCVSASNRPRPVEGSYMPVFNAGYSAGKMIASALHVPFYTFSHQEGHIEAVRYNSELKESSNFISFHFSGGTTEALLVKKEQITLVGGSKDLAFGQVLDRLGVALGMNFPCGEEMDKLICNFVPQEKNLLTRIKVKNGELNLSGIETQCQRLIGKVDSRELIYMTFDRLSQAICDLCMNLSRTYETEDFLFAGGVSSSRFMRKALNERLGQLHLCFGDPKLSTDNAVGTALLGGKKIWP